MSTECYQNFSCPPSGMIIAQVNTIYYNIDFTVIYVVGSTKNKITISDGKLRKIKTPSFLKILLVLIKIRTGLIR